jgi:hypothetical protein
MGEMAQTELNQLVTQVEFYRLQKGVYPSSLSDLNLNKQTLLNLDPFIQSSFTYKKNKDGYTLLSVGPDKTPYTQDDVYPSIVPEKSGTAFGYIRKP